MNISKSRKRRFHLYKDKKFYTFDMEIVNDIADADTERKKLLKKEVKEFFIYNWKDFGDTFLDHSLFDSKWVLFVRKNKRLIGIATLHKIKLEGKVFYNFKTNAVIPEYHSIGLLNRMNQILFSSAYIDNILSQKTLSINLIFSTPNLRIIGFFSKNSTHIYPDPYQYNREKRSIALPDDITWKYIQAYNKVDFPADLPLSKEACVVDDSLSQWPYACYEKSGFPYYKDSIVNEFGDHYLQYKEGKKRMFIVCALITPFDVVRYFLKVGLNFLRNILTFILIKA